MTGHSDPDIRTSDPSASDDATNHHVKKTRLRHAFIPPFTYQGVASAHEEAPASQAEAGYGDSVLRQSIAANRARPHPESDPGDGHSDDPSDPVETCSDSSGAQQCLATVRCERQLVLA